MILESHCGSGLALESHLSERPDPPHPKLSSGGPDRPRLCMDPAGEEASLLPDHGAACSLGYRPGRDSLLLGARGRGEGC